MSPVFLTYEEMMSHIEEALWNAQTLAELGYPAGDVFMQLLTSAKSAGDRHAPTKDWDTKENREADHADNSRDQ